MNTGLWFGLGGIFGGIFLFLLWAYLIIEPAIHADYTVPQQACQAINRGDAVIVNGKFVACTADRPVTP